MVCAGWVLGVFCCSFWATSPEDEEQGLAGSSQVSGRGMLALSKPYPMHHAHTTPHASGIRLFPPKEKCH